MHGPCMWCMPRHATTPSHASSRPMPYDAARRVSFRDARLTRRAARTLHVLGLIDSTCMRVDGPRMHGIGSSLHALEFMDMACMGIARYGVHGDCQVWRAWGLPGMACMGIA
eukprot:363113-Chlamydomonas_euryale.AAC.4